MTTTAPAVDIKTVKFAATAPIYAGETRYLAGSVSPGRTRVGSWCRHYHLTEADARACRGLDPAAQTAQDICPECGDFLAWCPNAPEFHAQRDDI